MIDDGRSRVAGIIEPACPTSTFLDALGEELKAAAADPSSVPYPELVDADEYWQSTVKPQGQSVRRAGVELVENLEARLAGLLAEAESELEGRVDAASRQARQSQNSAVARRDAIDDVAKQCQVLHHQLAELLTVLPSADPIVAARTSFEEQRRVQATTDVESLRAAYLQEAGGDDAHQSFAAQQWSETFSERIGHRDTMLRGQTPWRHLELAIVGHERCREAIFEAIEAAVERLQAPLIQIGERLVHRYDSQAG